LNNENELPIVVKLEGHGFNIYDYFAHEKSLNPEHYDYDWNPLKAPYFTLEYVNSELPRFALDHSDNANLKGTRLSPTVIRTDTKKSFCLNLRSDEYSVHNDLFATIRAHLSAEQTPSQGFLFDDKEIVESKTNFLKLFDAMLAEKPLSVSFDTKPKLVEENTMSTKDRYSVDMSETFISAIENGKAPWQNELNVSGKTTIRDMPPFNPTSGSKYKGFNQIYLKTKQGEMESPDPRWATAKQCEATGWVVSVSKHESTCITYYNTDTGNYQYNNVFNGSQIKNINPMNPDLVLTLEKKDVSQLPFYKAKDDSVKELLVSEISRYMVALSNGTEFKPSKNKNLSKEKMIDYLKNNQPTEMFYLCNKAYGATKTQDLEVKNNVERKIENSKSMEK
jgi:hypothetical protein